MRFKSIEIQNFRQYRELQFDFKKRGEHDLHIIIGQNGMGKTNILNAITWCLYGIEPHLGDISKSLPKINLEYKNQALDSGLDIANVIVKITSEDNGELITYERKLPVNLETDFEYKEEFTVSVSEPSKDTKIHEGEFADAIVNKYMPEKIRQYFYFDGEQLHNYFISEQSSKIKESVHAISQVDVLSRISKRLGSVITKKNNEAGLKAPNIDKINSEIKTITYQMIDSKKDIKELENQIKSSEKIIYDNTEQLRGQDNLPDLEERFQKHKSYLLNLENDKINIDLEIYDFIRNYKIILSFYPYAKQTLDIIDDKEKSNALPPNIDKKILEKMLLEHKCKLCLHDLDEHDEVNIRNLLDRIQVTSETSNLLMNIKSELERVIIEGKNYQKSKELLLKKKKQNENNILDTEKDMQKIDNEISRFTDKELIFQLHNERESHEKLFRINNQKLGVAISMLSESQKKLEILEKKLSQAMSKQDECKRINELVNFSKKGREIIEQIKNEMMCEVKNDMERITMEYFNKLVWKKNTYDRIELDENYYLDLYHNEGYSCVGSCSAAERSLLALSFTMALHEVSGFDSLLFIDTPVARVSDLNRINFANVLNDVSGNKQIIMTFSPDEYSEEIKNVFEKNASTNVKLYTNDEKTTILS